MLGTPFYFQTIRKVTVAFATLFNDIHLISRDSLGTQTDDTVVPLAFGPRSTYISKLSDQGKDEDIGITLPRMSFFLEGVAYDASRQKPAMGHQREALLSDLSQINKVMLPVPYIFSYSLSVYSKTIEDSLQITEQILPWFDPSFNVSIKEIPEINLVRDIPITLDSVDMSDNFEEGFDSKRLIEWNFSFSAKANLNKPLQVTNTIRKAITNVYQDQSMTQLLENINVEVVPPSANEGDAYVVSTSIT